MIEAWSARISWHRDVTIARGCSRLALMTQETRELLERALKLPPDDRALLVEALNAAVDEEDDLSSDPSVRAAWRDEIARRVREYREGRSVPIPVEAAFSQVMAAVERIRAKRAGGSTTR